jgi:hypothetical protein
MFNKILVAHDWIGPNRHYRNNQSFSIDAPLHKLMTNDFSKDYWKMIGGYQICSTLLLNEHDIFIYEVDLGFEDNNWIVNPESSLRGMCSITEDTLFKIRERNGFILLNISHESIFDKRTIYDIHHVLEKDNIPLHKVILQSGNPGLKEMYNDICHLQNISEKDRMHISTIEYFELVVSEKMHFFKENELPRNLKFENIKKTFLCFNRNHRPHRNNLLMLAGHSQFLDDSYYTMPAICPSQKTEWTARLKQEYIDAHGASKENIERIKNMLPLTVDIDDFSDPGVITNKWGDNQHLYQSSLISLVTETNYEEPLIFNTEKIFKPISYRHPFIMVGPVRTLEYLKSLGYRTFNEFWDESYDFIEDPVSRMTAIVNLCAEINNMPVEKKKALFHNTIPVTEHNYKLLKSMHNKTEQRRTFLHEFRDKWVYHQGYNRN